jgi:uncharacterized protein (UPF0276 family)
MELSVNYSDEAAELLTEGRIRFDRFKCPDWPDLMAKARGFLPIYVHFPLDAGSRTGRPPNFAQADQMARENDTPFVNLHLVTYARDFSEYSTDSRDPNLIEAVTDQMFADVNAAMAVVGRERLILENIPYFGVGTDFHRASVEARVIHRVVEETGCGFLLDISHARIAAHYMGVDPHEYVAQLPTDRLRELHVTGVGMHKNRLADHLDLREEDWGWFNFAMDRIHAGEWPAPWTVALEYGGIGEPFKWRSEKSALAEMVPRLYDVVHK